VRKRFRQEKKIEKAIKAKDDEVKRRYGLPESLGLVREDDPGLDAEAKEQFQRARRKLEADEDAKDRTLAGPVTSRLKGLTGSSAKSSLSATLLRNSLRHPGPFASQVRSARQEGKSLGIMVRK
jgi:coiled-coil domain-containing protein 130